MPEILQVRRELQQQRKLSAGSGDLVTLEVLQEWSENSRIAPLRLRQIWQDILSAAGKEKKSGAAAAAVGLRDDEVWWPSRGGRVPLRLWMEFAVEGDPEGMLDCDIGFQYHSRTVQEEQEMAAAVRSWVEDGPADHAKGEGTDSGVRAGDAELWYNKTWATVIPLPALEGPTESRRKLFEVRMRGDAAPSADDDAAASSAASDDRPRVLVIDGAASDRSWVPSGGVGACDGWTEMSAANGLETNSYSCHFSESMARVMLRSLLRATLPTLRAAFGVTRCEHRDLRSVGHPRKAFTTLLSRYALELYFSPSRSPSSLLCYPSLALLQYCSALLDIQLAGLLGRWVADRGWL
jgi:hypothetical protein